MASSAKQLQERLQYTFSDQQLLVLALSHRSRGSQNNERLEFLGDAVLGLTISNFLYRRFSHASEGDLSRIRSQIVRAESLAEIARSLELGPELLLGQGEMKSGGQRRDSILGDTVEALIGAIYLDGGILSAERCILSWFSEQLNAVALDVPVKDPKTALQEWLQGRGRALPEYQLVKTEGEDHSRLYTMSCIIDELKSAATATASSRRRAEQLVAEKILKELENK
ncbi:MAG: ribonuclease III [Porticoccaceae bacterium]|nr:MAG: ribonuclease III [SAR92 bacterium BACL16 MAG-120619-bin48]MDO7635582.1 ribonuclease III [Porticoccaceae bacterium]MDP4654945.1 ribonuclease III [Alphaproteobacteria bacterium]MDP4745471.1 ribonuclease III [Porticoccaceae bacterium]MDP4753506.1 ribonuclease III [Porticoccaceae bacterium]